MFEKSSSIIKDATKLSFDYVPSELVGRDGEMSTLEMLMRPVVEYGSSESALVTGTVGSGKTATVKRFAMNMADYCNRNSIPFGYIFVNCRQKTTDASALVQLIRHFDRDFPEKGFSPADMLQILRKHILKNGKRYLIILDEVDALIKRGSTDLIYQFSRFSDDEYNKVSLSLILISQEYVLNKLDQASLSSFKRANTVRFKKYSKEDLVQITRSRLALSIIDGCYDEEIVDMIADIASEDGDARRAIEIIEKSASIAERDGAGSINAECVRGAQYMITNLVTEDKLIRLNINKLVTLLAVSRCIRNKPYVSLPAAEKTYAVVCEEYDVVARKHTQFWTYINDLEKNGFLKTVKRMEPGEVGGAVTYISLTDVPATKLSKMIESIMEEAKDDEM